MKEEKTNEKKVLTDEELMDVAGGTGLGGDFLPRPLNVCEEITDQAKCKSLSNCVWATDRCKTNELAGILIVF